MSGLRKHGYRGQDQGKKRELWPGVNGVHAWLVLARMRILELGAIIVKGSLSLRATLRLPCGLDIAASTPGRCPNRLGH